MQSLVPRGGERVGEGGPASRADGEIAGRGFETQAVCALHLSTSVTGCRCFARRKCPPRTPGGRTRGRAGVAFRAAPPASFSHSSPEPPLPRVWGRILQGQLLAWNFFEVSHLIFKTHASCASCFVMYEYESWVLQTDSQGKLAKQERGAVFTPAALTPLK